MRKVRGKLCRNNKGKFTRCRGGKSSSPSKKKHRGTPCKLGVNKRTGRCLKNPRPC